MRIIVVLLLISTPAIAQGLPELSSPLANPIIGSQEPGTCKDGQRYWNIIQGVERFCHPDNIWNSQGALGGPWTRSGTTVSPTNAGDSVAITATVPAGAPSGSLAVGGSIYGDASNVSTGGLPVVRLDGWGPTVNSQTCSTNTLVLSGARVSDNLVPGAPSDLGAGLIFMALVTGPDVIQIRICNPTSGNVASGSGNGWSVKIAR